jgi:hypothetical protein
MLYQMHEGGYPMLKLLTLILSCVLCINTWGLAHGIEYPKPCYEGDELARIRQWEGIWTGKKITSTTLDQVKDFLPEGIYQAMKNPGQWGEIWFEIVPYRSYQIPPGRIRYTKEGKCKIGPREELLDWVAGVPFPEPRNGIEVAWNFDCWSRGDQSYRNLVSYRVDGKIKYDRKSGQYGWTMYFAGRCDIPPTPELQNPRGILRAAYGETYEPPAAKGNLSLMYRYKSPTLDDDLWTWAASIRRVMRISLAVKTDQQGGDLCYDDEYGWSGKINRQTYKLIGRKELLLARHQDISVLKRTEGECVYSGIQRERINVYVVEAVCKDPGYIYSKAIWFVDPELWHITYTEKYDQQGRFWKIIEHLQDEREGYQGIKDVEFVGAMFIDYPGFHATDCLLPELKIGLEIPLKVFSLSNLQNLGR